MKVHVHQIPPDSTLHVEEDIDGAILELTDPAEQPAGPIHCSLDVGLSDGGLFATGQLSVTIHMTCVACLQPFEATLWVPDFATQIELNGRESVDLTPLVREDILLVLPSHPRCDTDGGKTCPATFQSEHAPLTEEGDDTAWGALDQIKPKQ